MLTSFLNKVFFSDKLNIYYKLIGGNLPGSLCLVRLDMGVGGGVVPVPCAFDTYVGSVDSREPANGWESQERDKD